MAYTKTWADYLAERDTSKDKPTGNAMADAYAAILRTRKDPFADTIIKNQEIDKTPTSLLKTNTAANGVSNTTPRNLAGGNPNFKAYSNKAATKTVTPTTKSATESTETGGSAELKEPDGSAYAPYLEYVRDYGIDSENEWAKYARMAEDYKKRSAPAYGARAESLGQAGLTNSGMSEELIRAEYAKYVDMYEKAQQQYNENEKANKQGYAKYLAELKAYQEQKAAEKEANEKALKMAVSQAKTAYRSGISSGYTEESIADEIIGAYGEDVWNQVKADFDAQKADRDMAILGSTDGTIKEGSALWKLLNDDNADEASFLEAVEKLTGIEYKNALQAIESIYGRNSDIYKNAYKQSSKNSVENAVAGITSKSDLRKDLKNQTEVKEGEYGSAIYNALNDLRNNGGMSDDEWAEYANSIFNGTNPKIQIKIRSSFSGGVKFDVTVNGNTVGMTMNDDSFNRIHYVPQGNETKDLDAEARGRSVITKNGEVYVHVPNYGGDGYSWYRIGKVTGTKKNTVVSILELLGR